MAYKGKFKPKNYKKYIGNPSKIIYRSLWERKYMKYCDSTPSILKWSSEPLSIPYLCPTDNKWHKYFPDFYMKSKNKNNIIKEYIIEVKPLKQTKPPKKRKKTKQYIYETLTWQKNQAKWKFAEEYCSKNKWKFMILTERELQPHK